MGSSFSVLRDTDKSVVRGHRQIEYVYGNEYM
jgi:hypothetical protein